MNSLECYQYFHNCKLHFSQKRYDIRKYYPNQKRFNQDRFSADSGRYYYSKLAEKYQDDEIRSLIYTNLFINPGIWIADLFEKEAWNRYLWTKKYRDSMSTYFVEDVKRIKTTYGKLNGANIFTEIISSNIHPQTISLLSRIIPEYRQQCLDSHQNYVHEVLNDRLEKYDAFVSVPNVEFINNLKRSLRTIFIDK